MSQTGQHITFELQNPKALNNFFSAQHSSAGAEDRAKQQLDFFCWTKNTVTQ